MMWTPASKQHVCGWGGSYHYQWFHYLLWVEGLYKRIQTDVKTRVKMKIIKDL